MPEVRILRVSGLDVVEEALRVAGAQGMDPGLVVARGYTSVLEHLVVSFEARCSRVCSHQLVRHRVASYTQESLRRGPGPLLDAVRIAAEKGIVSRGCLRGGERGLAEAYEALAAAAASGDPDAREVLLVAFEAPGGDYRLLAGYAYAAAEYFDCLARGGGRDKCRYLLPQAVKTRIVVTMNARELLESFLPLRMCRRAHPEIRSLAWMLWLRLVEEAPAVFRYAGPRCHLAYMRALGRPLTLRETVGEGLPGCPEGLAGETATRCLRSLVAEELGSVERLGVVLGAGEAGHD